MKPVILIGGGGHAKVVASTLIDLKIPILGFVDPDTSKSTLLGLPRLGDDDAILTHSADAVLLVQSIGGTRPCARRAKVFDHFKSLGYSFFTAIHPTAIVANDVEIGEGTVVFAGAVVQPGTRIGANCILNTRCSVDHDCHIGPNNHIAPGATLSGSITTGPNCHIGVGATIIQGLILGENSLVGAGSVVLKQVPPNTTVFGIPARSLPRLPADRSLPDDRSGA
jgi:sugar O-acyltransferase (sialic acid O-acetyltransferase NeuD family)